MGLLVHAACEFLLQTLLTKSRSYVNGDRGFVLGDIMGCLAELRILLLDLECLDAQKVLQILNLVLCLCPEGVRSAWFLGMLSLIDRNEED